MITGWYRPDGSLEAVEIDYYMLDPAAREDVYEWIRGHDVDPGLVPVQCRIGFDPATQEWSFPVHVRGPHGGIRIDLATGEVMLRRVRRRAVAWLPRVDGRVQMAAGAVQMAARAGLNLDPWQADALYTMLASTASSSDGPLRAPSIPPGVRLGVPADHVLQRALDDP